jgi:hypothetical protein
MDIVVTIRQAGRQACRKAERQAGSQTDRLQTYLVQAVHDGRCLIIREDACLCQSLGVRLAALQVRVCVCGGGGGGVGGVW